MEPIAARAPSSYPELPALPMQTPCIDVYFGARVTQSYNLPYRHPVFAAAFAAAVLLIINEVTK